MVATSKAKFNLVLVLLSVMALSACVTNSSGSGPITLSPEALDGYKRFQQSSEAVHFAVTEDGSGYGWSYCQGNSTQCIIRPLTALSVCYKYNQKKCKIFAAKHGIIWQHSSGRPMTLAEVSGGPSSSSQNSGTTEQSGHSDQFVCMYALQNEGAEWSRDALSVPYIAEAKGRGFTAHRCGEILGR